MSPHFINTLKLDLIALITIKIFFCYFAYYFYTNFLDINIFKYPDMQAYKYCIGSDSQQVNIFYSQFLCSIGMNNEEALSGITLIFLACSINLFSICGFYLVFKDFLNRKGQILFIMLLACHPYLAIYFPRFYTDLFGSLGILLICYYSIKNVKVDYFFIISVLILINFRAALMPPFFLFIAYRSFKEFRINGKFNSLEILGMFAVGVNFLLFKVFSDVFLQATNFYSNKMYNIIFLLGFREAAANNGFMIFFNGSVGGYIQFFISLLLLLAHSLGIFSIIKFVLDKKYYGVLATLSIIVIPLIAISHLRYLLPIIPLIMFGFSWYFFKKELNEKSF